MVDDEECPHGMDDPMWCSICIEKTRPRVIEVLDDEYEFTARYDGHCG